MFNVPWEVVVYSVSFFLHFKPQVHIYHIIKCFRAPESGNRCSRRLYSHSLDMYGIVTFILHYEYFKNKWEENGDIPFLRLIADS